MPDRPTAAELVEAVCEFLETEIRPGLDDERLRFRTRVAMNALAIAQRDLASPGEEGLSGAELEELARRIRAQDAPEDTLRLLKEHVAAKLRVASPRYLDRYG